MSTAEIADNKWEVQASKPPVASAGGLLNLLMIIGFTALFIYITAMSVVAIVTPKSDNSLENQYKNMNKSAPTEAPAQ
ncbi:MAG: hypothetical protein K1X88_08295 [Nannocystaceae bacterium]|nr:hypothetical protein [Nannocystaceae bacterium]